MQLFPALQANATMMQPLVHSALIRSGHPFISWDELRQTFSAFSAFFSIQAMHYQQTAFNFLCRQTIENITQTITATITEVLCTLVTLKLPFKAGSV